MLDQLHLTVSIVVASLSIILAGSSIMCLLFYTKSQIDKKLKDVREYIDNKSKESFEKLDKDIKELKESVNEELKDLTSSVDEEISEIKEVVAEFKLLNQKERSEVKDELHEKLDDTKAALEDAMKQFITTITEIKQADKEMAVQFLTLVNGVKDELKDDYTARYNDLLVLINTKANEVDFNRLEQKFDRTFETITELKTIVQLQLDGRDKEKRKQ